MSNSSEKLPALRILILNWHDLAHPLAGGAEVYTHHVANEWIKMGHDVTLFCASVDGLPENQNISGLKIIRRGGKYSVYREAKKFYRTEGRGNFDLVVDEINTRPFGAPKWVKDAQVIALIHQVCREIWFYQVNFPMAIFGRYVLEPYWLSKYRDVLTITVSDSSMNSLEMYGLKKVVVVPEGFERSNTSETREKAEVPTLVFVGRLSPNKRPIDAIKAFELLRKKLPNSTLKIIGTGPLEKKIRKRLPTGAQLLGKLSEDEKIFHVSSAHALIATSIREGWGLVVTEASLVGTTSIAYDVPGLRDSVKSSNGILCAPNVKSLYKEILRFLNTDFDTESSSSQPSGVEPWGKVAEMILNESMQSISKQVQPNTRRK